MRDPVTVYARRVVSGKVLSCKWHRLACARHLRDTERSQRRDLAFPFSFDRGEALRAIDFAESLEHFKGEWAGRPIRLEPWEQFILGSLWGWKRHSDSLRRFRVGYVETPRGQGKSTLTAIIGLLLAFFDGEPAADVFSAATKKDQARIVWEYARRMVMASPELSSRIWTGKTALAREADGSRFVALGADADTTDGLRPHGGLIDEVHAHKNGDLIAVIETGMGTRRQPLLFEITTAGDDVLSVCFRHHDYICHILEEVFSDETWFGFITTIDEGEDWRSELAWRRANPNYGVSVKPDDLQRKCDAAERMPAAAAEFQRKHLNVWVNTANPCLSVDGWRKGQTSLPTALQRATWRDELLHERCYIGIDLASKIDLCALSLVFPPTETRPRWRVLQHVWTPEETVKDRSHRDRAPYDIWVAQGWLRTTPGSRIDHAVVRQAIVAARSLYDVALIGFDPWHADTLIDELVREDGFAADRVLAVPQTYQGMSSACLRMQAEILEGNVDAGGCPVTAWAVSNAVATPDGKDNLMFAKGKSRGRIDPLIAMTIAMALWLRVPAKVEPSYQMVIL